MANLDEVVEGIARKIKDLYAQNHSYTNGGKITTYWGLINELMPVPDFEQILQLLAIVQNPDSAHSRKCIRMAIELSCTPEQVMRVLPLLPASWVTQRRLLLSKIAELAKDKDELVLYMTKGGWI